MSRPARPLVIFGGGALGGTVAKLAASRGTPVIVASRMPEVIASVANGYRPFGLSTFPRSDFG